MATLLDFAAKPLAFLGLVAFLAFSLTKGYYVFIFFIVFLALALLVHAHASRQDQPANSPQSGWAALRFSLFYIALLTFLFWNAFATKGPSKELILAIPLWLMAGYPLWRHLRGKDQGVPWLPLIVLNYGFYFGMSVLLPIPYEIVWRGIAQETRIHTQILTLAGLSLALFAFYVWPRRLWQGVIPRLESNWSETKAKRFAFIAASIGLLVNSTLQVGLLSAAIREPLGYVATLSIIAIAVLEVLLLQGRLSPLEKGFLYAVILIQILTDISFGAVFPVTRLGAMLLMVYVFYRRDLPYRWLLLALPLIVLLLATKMEFRGYTARGESGNPIQRGFAFATISYNFLSTSSPTQLSLALQDVVQRFDMLSLFSYVVNETPYRVPYWEGQTYAPLFWKLIPRFVYPDKPSEVFGQEFGHRYGMVSPTDFTTAMNLPQMVEMYANFGTAGVVIGMFLLGLIWQALDFSLNTQPREWSVVSIAVVASVLINIESNFSLTYGSMINWVILMHLLGKLVQRPPGEARE